METSAKSNLAAAKIVAAPTLFSWSQVYNAGKLFAALSLQKETPSADEEETPDSLSQIGKNLLNKLEQEFFTIENKNIVSIKNAIEKTFTDFPNSIIYSFSACVLNSNVLYAFSKNRGGVFIKRGEKFGKILDDGAASGFLRDQDLVILTTKPFADLFPAETLSEQIQNQTPLEIAEALSPTIHEKEEAGASAIIFQFIKQEKEESKSKLPELKKYFSFPKILPNNLEFSSFPFLKLGRKKTLFLTLSVVLFLVLIFSIFASVNKHEKSKREALFNQVYPQAQKKYEEAQSLLDLNQNLARESLKTAQNLLNNDKSKFPKNSKEGRQISDILAKVNKDLEEISPEKIASNLNRSKIVISIQNGSGLEGVARKALDFLKSKGYSSLSTANADNYKYVGVTIKVKSSTNAYLNILKKDLSEKYTVSTTSSDLSKDATTDAVIIVGK